MYIEQNINDWFIILTDEPFFVDWFVQHCFTTQLPVDISGNRLAKAFIDAVYTNMIYLNYSRNITFADY